ncbi:hypothetical protein LMG28138_04882 [Pararobbsia alpina]|uniref:Uncharacterized protein n=1 Tax=Pararobbsia alpina TaxID=621374 RepID=A0A6S7BS69_9BURK|nr:hypothetical protein LMG28138_04882 [Pararobbsia alpina]
MKIESRKALNFCTIWQSATFDVPLTDRASQVCLKRSPLIGAAVCGIVASMLGH